MSAKYKQEDIISFYNNGNPAAMKNSKFVKVSNAIASKLRMAINENRADSFSISLILISL